MTTKTNKGKQSLPYLLSTTKTLVRCKRYYYNYIDYKFSSKRNRDCYTERNVRVNLTRQWHNIIIPNAILCRQYGHPATFADAIAALNYAMTHGKTQRSLEAWKRVCTEEANLPESERVVTKYRRSYSYYVDGLAATKEGLLYHLPKAKTFDIKRYTSEVVIKYIWKTVNDFWYCPWSDLNRLVDIYKHYYDDFFARREARYDRIDEIEKKLKNMWFESDERKALQSERDRLEKEDDDDIADDFPETTRAICAKFHVGMASAQRFRVWLKQMNSETDYKYLDDPRKIPWSSKKIKQRKTVDLVDTDIINIDTTESDIDKSIEHAAQLVANSGDRPVGRLDDSAELPF